MEQCDLDTIAVSLARLEARVEAIREMQGEANRTRDRSLEALNGANTAALALAREELTRRLDILNGEQSRIATLTAETMPREVFEAKQKLEFVFLEDVDDAVRMAIEPAAEIAPQISPANA